MLLERNRNTRKGQQLQKKKKMFRIVFIEF